MEDASLHEAQSAKYRGALPSLSGDLYLTDGGIETVLIFEEKQDLPHFAAFSLLKTPDGVELLKKYYTPFIELANEKGVGCILESATWRASLDWGKKLGYSEEELSIANQKSICILRNLRSTMEKGKPLIISGCVGPRGDGYVAGEVMTTPDAMDYHSAQVQALAAAGADVITGITMTNSAEAAGLVQACVQHRMPCVISFTLETDGALPSGETLQAAICAVEAAGPVLYYMLNCAHPSHFAGVLAQAVVAGEEWVDRIRGLRANASAKSHAELDAMTELDSGDAEELAVQCRGLKERALPALNVLGGCCGTNVRHVAQMHAACAHLFAS
uniref:Hcy-binding domain-containing protein n=1 Tax=Ditylum brightwellii TaxID=49249 RepID=A0A6U3TK87_9STRA|mmetsp:Transcript_36452/g.54425  ORF Transcript_36452/g.54425 Transcript_36452/m.54425 type:complete len:330 (+) Transcript_36452:153-1142(+)